MCEAGKLPKGQTVRVKTWTKYWNDSVRETLWILIVKFKFERKASSSISNNSLRWKTHGEYGRKVTDREHSIIHIIKKVINNEFATSGEK